jgi:hypothetical protein
MLGIGIQAKQPWSYRLQSGFSAILLTQKHAGLVYGNGPINLKHKTFFTILIKS